MVRSRISCFKKRLGLVLIAPLLFLGMCQTYVFGGLAKVEKTGQIISYSGTGGEDGDLQNGVAWPSPRFKDNGNGAVTDNLTKLIWLKNANAFGIRTWEEALSDANTLASGSAGLTDGSKAGDWRLPNKKELESLIDCAYFNPALSSVSGKSQWVSGDIFTGVQSNIYWSSTTYSANTANAWSVNLNDGYVGADDKTSTYYVWPVRAGQQMDSNLSDNTSSDSCTYSLTTTSKSFTSKGGSGSVWVGASSGCNSWTAVSNATWIRDCYIITVTIIHFLWTNSAKYLGIAVIITARKTAKIVTLIS